MPVYEIDPVEDPRWRALVEAHPRASVFHSPGWLAALRRTYGFQPSAFTTAAPGADLTSGVVVCQIRSWLTGHRLVSLPFSDHCEPLADTQDALNALLAELRLRMEKARWAYMEIRPLHASPEDAAGWGRSESFHFHRLDLRPGPDELYRRFHKNAVQQPIRRAEREGLSYAAGRSEPLLEQFYRLLLLTRRRHQLPPQPYAWFRNLIACLGDALTIRVAYRGDQPIASILTLAYKDTLVYKYGGSDPAFHPMGGTPLLLWKAIQEAGDQGLQEMDLGRSDWDNEGLATFKDRWGATRSTVTYYRYPATAQPAKRNSWKVRVARQAFGRIPDRLLTATGNFLYRHLG